MNCRERKEAFMELELKKESLDVYETGGELTLTQEELKLPEKSTYTVGSCGTEKPKSPARCA